MNHDVETCKCRECGILKCPNKCPEHFFFNSCPSCWEVIGIDDFEETIEIDKQMDTHDVENCEIDECKVCEILCCPNFCYEHFSKNGCSACLQDDENAKKDDENAEKDEKMNPDLKSRFEWLSNPSNFDNPVDEKSLYMAKKAILCLPSYFNNELLEADVGLSNEDTVEISLSSTINRFCFVCCMIGMNESEPYIFLHNGKTTKNILLTNVDNIPKFIAEQMLDNFK